MALIKCPECKKEMSDYADKCPNCGYPVKTTTSAITGTSAGQNTEKNEARLTIAVPTSAKAAIGLGMILMKENEFYETIGRLVVGLSGLAIAFCLFFGVLVPLFKYFIHLL